MLTVSMPLAILLATVLGLDLGCDQPPHPEGYVRGDVNGDVSVSIADPIALLDYLFGSAELSCANAADSTDDRATDIADAIYLLTYLFAGGPPPSPPFPDPGGIAVPLVPSLFVQDAALIGAIHLSVTRDSGSPVLAAYGPDSEMVYRVDEVGAVALYTFASGESFDVANFETGANPFFIWESGPIIFDTDCWWSPDFLDPAGFSLLYESFDLQPGTGDIADGWMRKCAVIHDQSRLLVYDGWTGKLFSTDTFASLPDAAPIPHHDAMAIREAICAELVPCPFDLFGPFTMFTELEEIHETSQYLAYEETSGTVLRGDLLDDDPTSLEVLLLATDFTAYTGEPEVDVQAMEVDTRSNLYFWDAASDSLLRRGNDDSWATLASAADLLTLTGGIELSIEDMSLDRFSAVLYLLDASTGSVIALAPQ